MRRAVALAIALLFAGCPSARRPTEVAAGSRTIPLTGDLLSLRGVAGDSMRVYEARVIADHPSTPEHPPYTGLIARITDAPAWTTKVHGTGGPIAVGGGIVLATFTGAGVQGAVMDRGRSPVPAVRGEPGGAVLAVDAATGAERWRFAFDASEWVVITDVAAAADGFVVVGSFAGNLRVRDKVVSSAGRSDGFVARLSSTGDAAWLVRLGGPHADGVQGVDVRDGRIAIAGTAATGAELRGHALPAFDDKTPLPDGFVAVLDDIGAHVWSATFGGKQADSVAGVAIDGAGRVVVAANARDVVHVGSVDVTAQGRGDALIAWWTKAGVASHAIAIGGADFDGVRAIAAVGERIVVGGFYSGAMHLGDRAVTAGGGDDAFLVALDERGSAIDQWDVGGAGREDIVALSAIPGGFVAGVSFTAAASIAGVDLAAPGDPMTGAAIVVRGVR